MAAAAAKLANIARIPSLQSLLCRRNLLRSHALSSAAESLFNRKPANVNVIPALGVSYGMLMGLPRVDQSPTILEFAGKRKPAVKDDSDIDLDDDDVVDDDFPDNDYDSDDYTDSD